MKLKQIKEKKNGWSKNIFPRMSSYFMQCCDCGLVHEIKFKAIIITKRKKNKCFIYKKLSNKKFGVAFKVRRHSA